MNSVAKINLLRQANRSEYDNNFHDAMDALVSYARQPTASKFLYRINMDRVLYKMEIKARQDMLAEIEVHTEHEHNPRAFNAAPRSTGTLINPVVSLTTISSRIERVPKTVKTLLKQSLMPHSVNLYISQDPYLVDEGILPDHGALGKLSDLGVNIYFTRNIGPYRKQYPVIKQLLENGAPNDTPIITVDDDVLYPSDILEKLVTNLYEHDAVIAHRGRKMLLNGIGIDSYKKFTMPEMSIDLANLGTGRNGIAYKLDYFPTDYRHFIGPFVAPTADDLWCKWVTAKSCIPTMILEPRAAFDKSYDFPETDDRDRKSLFHSFNSSGSNDKAIACLEHFVISTNSVSVCELIRG